MSRRIEFWNDVGKARDSLDVRRIRKLGVPERLISDYELLAAIKRDRDTEEPIDDAAYDRRGLLNVLAYLIAREAS